MASEEHETLRNEINEEEASDSETHQVIKTFCLTPDGILKPIETGVDSSKFCKAIDLMKATTRQTSSGRRSIKSWKLREAEEDNLAVQRLSSHDDPDVEDTENTPVRSNSRPTPNTKLCEYCSKNFSEKGLVKHIKNKHPEKLAEYSKTVPLELTDWMCPYCLTFLHSRTKLTSHVKSSHADLADEFSVILDLDMSAETEEANNDEPSPEKNIEIKPRPGTKRQKTSLRYVDITQKRARKREYPKPCPDCGEMIDRSSRWFDHRKRHIPLEERRSHQCGYCDQMYTKRALEVHIKTIHPETVPEAQRTWPCRFCDRVFRRTNTRHYHELTHKQDSKKYVCEICNYAFTSRSQLRKHRLTHSNTSVRCSKCRFLFEDVEKLTAHCERVHPGDEVYGMINEVRERSTPIMRQRRSATKGNVYVRKPVLYTEYGEEYHLESDDSNEANEMYERARKFIEKEKEDGTLEKEVPEGETNFELFRCKLCNVFYHNKAALAEHCLELHNDMMEKLVLAGL